MVVRENNILCGCERECRFYVVVRENKILCGCEREQDFMWL